MVVGYKILHGSLSAASSLPSPCAFPLSETIGTRHNNYAACAVRLPTHQAFMPSQGGIQPRALNILAAFVLVRTRASYVLLGKAMPVSVSLKIGHSNGVWPACSSAIPVCFAASASRVTRTLAMADHQLSKKPSPASCRRRSPASVPISDAALVSPSSLHS